MKNESTKKILALSGGGYRGILSLAYLEKIENLLAKRENNPNYRLCDYFDLIGGTSTGAIIAGALSIGMSVSEVTKLYLGLGDKIFGKKYKWYKNPIKLYKARFDFRPLENELKRVFKDITLGSDRIKTNLCIITKRADTLSTWPLINNPKGKYFEHNKNILLSQLIRASAAAPTYFLPQKIDVGFGEVGSFIDGGVSLSNNPSLQLFLVATLEGFKYNWETGEDKLSIISVGTGSYSKKFNPDKIAKKGLIGWAKMIPELFMHDADYLNQTMLQYLSSSKKPVAIDSEIGDLKNDLLSAQSALHYIRYNRSLNKESLSELGFNLSQEEVESLVEMSNAQHMELLYKIGKSAAEIEVKIEDLK